MDGYKYLVAGWVGNVACYKVTGSDSNSIVVRAKVRHSQTVTAQPAQPWVAAETNGTIVAAHCTCMAGLGEVCSHVSALLFTVEAHTKFTRETSCTSEPCQWLPPSMKKVHFAPISDVDFSAPGTKRKRLVNKQDQCTDTSPSASSSRSFIMTTPSDAELENLFDKLSRTNEKPALLSILPKYNDHYVVDHTVMSEPLLSMFKDEYLSMQYDELVHECHEVFKTMSVSDDQVRNIELATREQSLSKEWFRFRAGRITASRFKASIRTNPLKPSQSLIKSICYPESVRFSTKATRWGCEHEKTARDAYFTSIAADHSDLTVSDSGLVIHPQYPHLGASPDGLVNCSCCGSGVIEVKCPFSCVDRSFLESTNDSRFCLEHVHDGCFALKTDHTYYYQIQLQMKYAKSIFVTLLCGGKKSYWSYKLTSTKSSLPMQLTKPPTSTNNVCCPRFLVNGIHNLDLLLQQINSTLVQLEPHRHHAIYVYICWLLKFINLCKMVNVMEQQTHSSYTKHNKSLLLYQ